MKKLISIFLMLLMLTAILPLNSFAANGDANVSFSGSTASQYTTKTTVTARVKSNTGSNINDVWIELNKGSLPGDVTLKTSFNNVLTPDEKELVWDVDLTGVPLGNPIQLTLTLRDSTGNLLADPRITHVVVNPIDSADRGKPNYSRVTPIDNTFKNDTSVNYVPKMQLNVSSNSLNAGNTNNIVLNVKNIGNAPFNSVIASITLGEGMTLNGGTLEKSLGSMNTQTEKSATFPVSIKANHTGGNVPLTFTVKAIDPTGKENVFTITQYLNVSGGTSLADQLEIVNVSNPSTVVANKDFNINFAVRNNSSQVAKNIKITVEPTTPVVNKTKNIFVESLSAGEVKNFSVTMFAGAAAESQNYPIKITAETQGENATSITQYSGIFVSGDSSKTVPQIIITNYSYGDSDVIANKVFKLTLSLKNTNKLQNVKNIRVSLNAEDGIFIPHNTSGSFYIDSIAPNATMVKTVELMTKPDAPEKTVSINVDMAYEDAKGNPITNKDIISVPVVQERRIEIDNVEQFGEIYVGEAGNLSIKYYNMGKNTLNNLIIDVAPSEDFTFQQSPKSFIGKFDAGKSDVFDFTIVPSKEGTLKGKVIFQFEDSVGKITKIEKEFTAEAVEIVMPEFPDGEFPEDANSMGNIWKWAIGGSILLLAITGGFILYKRKKKMNDSLDIDME